MGAEEEARGKGKSQLKKIIYIYIYISPPPIEHLPYRHSPGPFKHFLSINPSILPASHPQEVNTGLLVLSSF